MPSSPFYRFFAHIRNPKSEIHVVLSLFAPPPSSQRVSIATHVAAHMSDFEKSDRGLLEFALTPPADYMG